MQRSSSQFKNLNQLPINRNRQNGTDKPSSDVLALRKNQKNSTSCLSTTDSPMFYFGFEKSPSSTNISSEEIPYFNLGPAALTLRKNLGVGHEVVQNSNDPSSTSQLNTEQLNLINSQNGQLRDRRQNLSYGALSTFHPGQPQPQDENRSRSSSLSSTSSSGLEKLQFELEL